MDPIAVARQQLLDRMYSGLANGYAAQQPQLAMQAQPNVQPGVPAPSAAVPVDRTGDATQAQAALGAMQGAPMQMPTPPSATPPPPPLPPPASSAMGTPYIPPTGTAAVNLDMLNSLRAQWQQNIHNDPGQAMAIYNDLAQRGFSPEQVRQLLGAGEPSPDLMAALQRQSPFTVDRVAPVPDAQRWADEAALQRAYQEGGVRALSPQQGAGLSPWPTSFNEASVGYNDPNALLAYQRMMMGQQQLKNLNSPQTQRLEDMYRAGANALVPGLIDKTVTPNSYALMASMTADTLHQMVQGGKMTQAQATAQYNQYLQRQEASVPGFIQAVNQFGVNPNAAMDNRVSTRPNFLAYGQQNPMMRNMDFGNTPPPDVTGATPQQGPPPALPDGSLAEAPPSAEAAPTEPMGLGGAPASGPQPRVTSNEDSMLLRLLPRMGGLTPADKEAIQKAANSGVSVAAIMANPRVARAFQAARAASKGSPNAGR